MSELRPHAWIRPDSLRLQIAFLSSSDSKRCPTHDALVKLHQEAGRDATEASSIAAEGDRLLLFGWRRADLDRDGRAVHLTLIGAPGPTWHQSTRLWPLAQAAGLVFVPSPQKGYEGYGQDQAQHVRPYLEAGFPLAVAYLRSGRPEWEAEELTELLGLQGAAVFTARRDTGAGLRAALDHVVTDALKAFNEGRVQHAGLVDVPALPS
ncbi:MAG TPA: hypothetical protein DEA08_30820 [Planctomycetes bacterium]|nr:hypothetical protein [Planctomycetota bacterium]